MNNTKWPAVSLNALSMFENALKMFSYDFEMDLQRISVLLKNIANVSNAMEMLFNAFSMR